MMAISNSEYWRNDASRSGLFQLVLCVGFWGLMLSGGWAASGNAVAVENLHLQNHAMRMEQAYLQARSAWREQATNNELAWKFGRACFDYADVATTSAQRAVRAEEGIAACRQAIAREPKLAPAHYYLGLNLGQLARTKLLGALKLLKEMQNAWRTTIDLDPLFDYAGGHRSLGMLYRDAPGWPTSIGDNRKAVQHLETAVKLAPEYPDNWITLLEAYVQAGHKAKARERIATAEEHIKKAHETLAGEAWATSWRDWEQRWDAINRSFAK